MKGIHIFYDYNLDSLATQLNEWLQANKGITINSLAQSECYIPQIGLHITVTIVYSKGN